MFIKCDLEYFNPRVSSESIHVYSFSVIIQYCISNESLGFGNSLALVFVLYNGILHTKFDIYILNSANQHKVLISPLHFFLWKTYYANMKWCLFECFVKYIICFLAGTNSCPYMLCLHFPFEACVLVTCTGCRYHCLDSVKTPTMWPRKYI